MMLGGGGVRGASWIMGALYGLATETGWDPASADLVVGTSAGAVVGALTLAGAKPWEALAPDRQNFLRALLNGASFHPQPTLRSLWSGSPPLLRRALLAGPSPVAAAMPEGFVSTEPIVRLVRDWAPLGWPAGQRLWIVATEFATGDRVAFGRAVRRSPSSGTRRRLRAPSRPVRIGGRRYVDGGVYTGANLDIVAGEPLDLVICVNPLSSRPGTALGIYWPVRTLLHQQVVPQMRAVEEAGARLVVLEPDGWSINLIGLNPMSSRRVDEVGVAAAIEVQSYLQRPSVRLKLAGLRPPQQPPAAMSAP